MAPIVTGYEQSGMSSTYLSEVEREARRTVARQLLALGVSLDALPRAMADQGWPMARSTARLEYEAVMAEWVADHAAFRESTRVAQIRRLEGDLVRYRSAEAAPEGSEGARTRWQACVQTETLLARIQGHFAPIQHEHKVEATVVVKSAMVEIITSLSEADMERLLLEEQELEQLAAVGRRYSAIDVEGVPVAEKSAILE